MYTAGECTFSHSHVEYDSGHVCCREFQQKFPGDDIPARSAIHHFANKFKTMGPVLDNKTKTGCHTVTEEKLDSNGVRLEHLPRKWLAKEAQQLDVSVFSASTATKLLKRCP
jgi:hypothetical protein